MLHCNPGHILTWDSDQSTQLSSFRLIVTHEVVKIERRAQNSTAKEGHNSTKNPLNIDPGSVFNGGVHIYVNLYEEIFSLERSCLFK